MGVQALQTLGVGLLLGCMAIAGVASAAALPKGNCADPKPFTDLRHCRFEGVDLRNKDLRGADLRGISLYKTQLQGANLTNALFGGSAIVHASLEGVIGLSAEALAILNSAYLVSQKQAKVTLSRLPSEYAGSNESVAGLDNVFLAQKTAGNRSTIALLTYPRYGAASTTIFARFDNNKFDFPACYQSVDLMNDGNSYYFAHWESLKIRELSNGGYLIGAFAYGNDGDEMGLSEWNKIAILELTPTCKLTVLHEEFLERGGNTIERNGKYIEVWCGGALDYRFVDDQTAEIKTVIPVSSKKICGEKARDRRKIEYKRIRLNLQH